MISLSMIVWEKNYEKVLTDSWFIDYKSDLVKEKLLIVNNVDNIDNLLKLAEGKDLKLVFVKDYKDQAIEFFKLNMDEKTKGYYYTIPYFVALLACSQPYLFNVADDLEVEFNDKYLEASIKELDNKDVLVTTLQFGPDDHASINEAETATDDFFYAKTMADCLFIGKVDVLKQVDYNEYYEDLDYPLYSGNSFDKRLRMYMLNHDKCRAIYKHGNYKV